MGHAVASNVSDLIKLAKLGSGTLPSLVALGFVASLAEGIGIGLFIPLLDLLLDAGPRTEAGPLTELLQGMVPAGDTTTQVVAIVVAILTLVALRTAVLAADLYLATSLAARTTCELRIACCRQLLEVGYGYFPRADRGRVLSTIDTHTYRTGEAIVLLGTALIHATAVAVGISLLLLLSWRMTLVVAAMLAPALYAVWRLSRAAHAGGESLVQAYSTMAARGLEMLQAMRTIRIFGQERAEEQRFAAAAGGLGRAFGRSEALNHLVPVLAELLYLPAFIAALGYAWYAELGIPSALVFMVLLYRLQPQLLRLDQARVMLASLVPSYTEVASLVRRDDKLYLSSGSAVLARGPHRIEFEAVTFRHAPDGPAALDQASFTVGPGELVVVTGSSGAGKSTMVDLLCRLYDPASGTVRIDGVALPELDLERWRQRIAFAGQDAELLYGTIRDNLSFGRDGATEVEVRSALERAQALEFVARLPAGLETQVGPGGAALSAGQRQRLALARALLRGAEVLLLDEATNAVDLETDQAIDDAVARCAGAATVIVVSHRLETLRRAPRIIAIEAGRIVADGPARSVLAARDALPGAG